MKIMKLENGWRVRIGGVAGEPFCVVLRYFNCNGYRHKKGFRLIIDLNSERLVKLFGFNERVINF